MHLFLVALLASSVSSSVDPDPVLAALRKLDERFDALVDNFDALADNVRSLMDNMSSLMESVGILGEVLVTPAVAARLEACAASTAVFAMIRPTNKQCSAVPLPRELLRDPAAAASHFFFTSAHCFFNASTGNQDGTLVSLFFNNTIHACAPRATLHGSHDISLISCAAPVPVPPSRLSTLPYAAQLPVALMGFSVGAHMDPASGEVWATSPDLKKEVYARHVRYTRLANSLQLPRNASAPAAFVSIDVSASARVQQPYGAGSSTPAAGFVDANPEQGMSGGAVVDSHCGVLGITELQSAFGQGGRFVRLVQHISEWAAREAHAGA